MAGFRQVPHELWFREQRRYPWVAQFLCEVSYDEHRLGKPRAISFYSAKFGATRDVIRRLIRDRAIELGVIQPETRATPEPHPSHSPTTATPSDINSMEDRGHTRATPEPHPSHTSLETETETETEEKKKRAPAARSPHPRKRKVETTIPPDWPTEPDRDRIDRWNAKRRDPYPLPELERRLDAFRLRCESNGTLGANFTSRFMDYCNRGFLEPPAIPGESAAQARVRRSLEAGAEAARILNQEASGQGALRLLAGGGGGE